MGNKEEFKQKNYQLVFDNLLKESGGNLYNLYSWDFYYYVASGFYLEKKEINQEFLLGFFKTINLEKRTALDKKADSAIKGIYLRLLKKDQELNGSFDYFRQAQYIKKLIDAVHLLEQEDKTIEHQFMMEYLVIDFAYNHLKSNRNDSIDSHVLALLNLFDFTYFSDKPYTTIDSVKNKQIVHSSKQEKYFMAKIKLQQKLSLFEESIYTIDLAIATIKDFHEQNDITLIRKKTAALIKLGKIEIAKQMIIDLLKQKTDWYIFADLGDIYQTTNDKNDSIINFLTALLMPPDDFHIKVNVINRLAKLLNEKDPQFSNTLFCFEYNLRKEKQWNISEELKITYDPALQTDAKKIKYRCLNMLYTLSKSKTAKISKILPNGKSGFIDNYFFQFRNLMFRKEQATEGTSVEFITIETKDRQGKATYEALFITRVNQ